MNKNDQRALAKVREWLAAETNRDWMLTAPKQQLQESVSNGLFDPVVLANRLQRIRQWLLSEGVCLVLDGSDRGLEVVALANEYGLVACRALRVVYNKQGGAPFEARLLGIGLLEALALGRTESAREWASFYASHPPAAFYDWDDSPVAAFAISLWNDFDPVNQIAGELSLRKGYRFCIENWRSGDPAVVNELFDGLTNEHKRQSREGADFDDEALRVFPIEERAVRWLRHLESVPPDAPTMRNDAFQGAVHPVTVASDPLLAETRRLIDGRAT